VAATLERAARAAGFEPLEVHTIISELDRTARFAGEEVARAAIELTGKPPPGAGPTPDWMHAHRLGYKLLGYFSSPGHAGA
jgi:hypothetical protein